LRRRPLAETGHAEYFDRSAAARLPGWLAPFAPSPAERAAEWERLQGGIRANVEARRYDLILLGQFPSPLIPRAAIEANYRRVGAIEIDMPWALQRWPVQVWRPLP